MSRPEISSTAVLLGLLLVAAVSVADDCNPGFQSPGWIWPRKDVYVLEDKPVEMLCVLNRSHPLGWNRTADDLHFTVDGGLDRPALNVDRVNGSAIRLRIDSAPVSPDGFYMVNCNLGHLGICTRHIYVGYRPSEVTDFQCLSRNWKNLECTWKTQPNPVRANYTLYYASSITSRRVIKQTCPAASSNATTCVLTPRTTPMYMPTHLTYNFTMSISNVLANLTQYLGVVDNYAVVLPDAMEDLKAVATDAKAIRIRWTIPSALNYFPPGLKYRVTFTLQSTWSDQSQHEVDTSSLRPNDKVVELTLQVPFANADYLVAVTARSAAADASQERLWSEPALLNVSSAPDRPCAPPEAPAGSFEVINTRLETRAATLYWSPLAVFCRNGDPSGYVVDMTDLHGHLLKSMVVHSAAASSVHFDDLARNQHLKFQLRATNNVGASVQATELFLPADLAMPSKPEDVMRIVYNATLYEVSWSTPASSSAPASTSVTAFVKNRLRKPQISHFTVFWCRTIRDNPVVCLDRLEWRVVEADVTSVNVTVADPDSNYQFAVQANQGDYASGLVWSGCVINANGNGSRVKDLEVVAKTNTSLDLQWSLPCQEQNGIVKGFHIYYCSVAAGGDDEAGLSFDEEPDCDGEEIRLSVFRGFHKRTINGLEPFTWYKMVITVRTRFGESQTSTPLIKRTLPGVPSAPWGLKVADLADRRVALKWHSPIAPRSSAVEYGVYVDDVLVRHVSGTSVVLDENVVQGFTRYNFSVRACQSPVSPSAFACSPPSEMVSVRTKIGVPGVPLALKIRPAPVATSDDGEIDAAGVAMSWTPPEQRAGPIDLYVVEVQYPAESQSRTINVTGNGEPRLVELVTADLCPAKRELSVRLRAANRDELDQLLLGPWTASETYPCPASGLALSTVLGISLGFVGLVLMIAIFSVLNRRFRRQRKAEQILVVMPWEDGGVRSAPPAAAGDDKTRPAGVALDQIESDHKLLYKVGEEPGLVVPFTNHYSLFETKMTPPSAPIAAASAAPMAPTVVDNKVDSESFLERQSRSSGCGSANDSFSWHHTCRSETSNSSSADSGAELEPPNSPGLDNAVSGEWNGLDTATSSVAAPPLLGAVKPQPMDALYYSTINFVQVQSDPAMDDAEGAPAPYVRLGVAADAGVGAAKSAGYVTLGDASAADVATLAADEKRRLLTTLSSRPQTLQPDDVEFAELRPAATQGYVTLKSCDVTVTAATAADAASPASCVEVGKTAPQGYVTLGALATSTAPTPGDFQPASGAHYVSLGVAPVHYL